MLKDYYTFREIINGDDSIGEIYVIYEDKSLHYYMMKSRLYNIFEDVMFKKETIEVPEDKLDTYGYHGYHNGIKCLVTTCRSDVSMYLRKVLQMLNPHKSSIKDRFDYWFPVCDRYDDYCDPYATYEYYPWRNNKSKYDYGLE